MKKWMKPLHGDSMVREEAYDGPLIKLENLVKIYNTGTIKVLGLKKINLAAEWGEFVIIMGHPGSREPTLMNISGCLDRFTLGHYHLDGTDAADIAPGQLSDIRNRKVGFMLQSFDLISRTSAPKNMELPMTYARMPKAKRAVRAQLLLKRAGLGARKEHMPSELSGGQRQGVAIVRALADEPPLVLADEPTENLGIVSSVEVMEPFTKLHREGITVVLVTHEEGTAASTHRVIRLNDGQIQSDKSNAARVTSEDRRGGKAEC